MISSPIKLYPLQKTGPLPKQDLPSSPLIAQPLGSSGRFAFTIALRYALGILLAGFTVFTAAQASPGTAAAGKSPAQTNTAAAAAADSNSGSETGTLPEQGLPTTLNPNNVGAPGTQLTDPKLDPKAPVLAVHTRQRITDYTFKELATPLDPQGGMFLTGANGRGNLGFEVLRNELVTDAYLTLVVMSAPSLVPVRSHIQVFLNGTLQEAVPIQKEMVGKRTTVKVKLNPLLMKHFNTLTFEFIGHYEDVCENVINSTIWLNLTDESLLTLTTEQLRMANDLSFLPLPFVNDSGRRGSTVSFIFPEVPSKDFISAAAMVSSWCGVKAQWRGVDIPVIFDALPDDGHAVVFVTNDKRPYFLQHYPVVKRPRLEMADLPHSDGGKLLILAAPDEAGLLVAARALTQGDEMFTGPVAEILRVKEFKKREPYDAPKWIDTSKKTYFSSLIDYEEQLMASGFRPAPLMVTLNLPPDLYFVEGSRIDLDLKYRYTRPFPETQSQLQFLINGHLIRSYELKAEKESDHIFENLPLVGSLDLSSGGSKIESTLLHPSNNLSFDFQYTNVFKEKKDECSTQTPITKRVEIDPRSFVDFTGIYHFARMPNLGLFWQSGYPFSVYADLQNTAAVIEHPEKPAHLTTLFNTLARIGGQLGLAQSELTVLTAYDESAEKSVKDKDILVIGQLPERLSAHEQALAVITQEEQALTTSFNDHIPLHFDVDKKTPYQQVSQASAPGHAAILSFQSPYHEARTVVALVSDSVEAAAHLNTRIVRSQQSDDVQGSLTLFKPNETRSYDVGESYFVGNLPWYQRVWYYLLESPWLLMLCTVLSAAVFCVLIYRILSRIRRSRLFASGKEDKA
ncbi:MAG: cellulose biosynthesis cyclic di-GMP-binding regulatory protein BcsB [Succinivibrio sp.]|nr:cellulose biosynthesis cyclic di-GMP-binding regulatory protein BcsB [Succinivibrio sp.]